MPIRVAEYLGQKIIRDTLDKNSTSNLTKIKPIGLKTQKKCPFANIDCYKLKEGKHPICSVRKNNEDFYITCKHRLCSTSKYVGKKSSKSKIINLTGYQESILNQIIDAIYDGEYKATEVELDRETTVPTARYFEGDLQGLNPYATNLKKDDIDKVLQSNKNVKLRKTSSKADYCAVVKTLNKDGEKIIDKLLIELQGGGETSGTGNMTRTLNSWLDGKTSSEDAFDFIEGVNTIETNAWRRQQEQILVKGNIAQKSKGKAVLVIGKTLYEYLDRKFNFESWEDLKENQWNLCILHVEEDYDKKGGSVSLKISKNQVFTQFQEFVAAIGGQGSACKELFLFDEPVKLR